jgi:hypothetical protein
MCICERNLRDGWREMLDEDVCIVFFNKHYEVRQIRRDRVLSTLPFILAPLGPLLPYSASFSLFLLTSLSHSKSTFISISVP